VCKCLDTNTNPEFIIKTNLLKKTGCTGILVSDFDQVFINKTRKNKEFYISILHEVFHCYFKDAEDSRKKIPSYDKDPVECRAEESAQSTYRWYRKKCNVGKFCEFRLLTTFLPREKLSLEDMEDLS